MHTQGFFEQRLDYLSEVLTGYVDRGVVPGLVALVSRRGATHILPLGTQALGDDVPMRRDSIFRIASMTKPITAAAVMLLVEECRLRLDDPIDDLLPELADRQVLKRIDGPVDDTEPARRPITTRDLLAFTAGYGVILAEPGSYPIQSAIAELGIASFGPPASSESQTPEEWLAQLGSLPLFHQPGEQWLYNTGSYILGILIERAAGQPFDAFLRSRIFEPLGMTDTGFSVPASKRERLTACYTTGPLTGDLSLADAAETSSFGTPPAFPSGGSGLVSTVDDMLAFGQLILGNGSYNGQRILSRAAMEVMTTDRLSATQHAASPGIEFLLNGQSWGFGGMVVQHRDRVGFSPGSFGWSGGYGTTWYVDPAEELITILMTQASMTSATGPAIFRDFWTLAYAALGD